MLVSTEHGANNFVMENNVYFEENAIWNSGLTCSKSVIKKFPSVSCLYCYLTPSPLRCKEGILSGLSNLLRLQVPWVRAALFFFSNYSSAKQRYY